MRNIALVIVISIVILAIFKSGEKQSPAPFQHALTPPPSPWIGKDIDVSQDKFTFALFSDLTGGEREGIFDVAAEQLALFRPDFIVTVGDLIEGYTEEEAELKKEWDSFEARADKAGAPIFRVGGNHDLTNLKMREVWAERYGPRYYYFIYRNVLFLILDSEDYSNARMQEIYQARNAYVKVQRGPNPELAKDMEYRHMIERNLGEIGEEQSSYFKQVLEDNPDVRWTFLFMHKPTYLREDGHGLEKVETALQGRNYTVINGHDHEFKHQVRHGMDYIILGTTGGIQWQRTDQSFDHLSLITMDTNGPNISHIKMEGILDKTGNIPADGNDLCYQKSKCGTEE